MRSRRTWLRTASTPWAIWRRPFCRSMSFPLVSRPSAKCTNRDLGRPEPPSLSSCRYYFTSHIVALLTLLLLTFSIHCLSNTISIFDIYYSLKFFKMFHLKSLPKFRDSLGTYYMCLLSRISTSIKYSQVLHYFKSFGSLSCCLHTSFGVYTRFQSIFCLSTQCNDKSFSLSSVYFCTLHNIIHVILSSSALLTFSIMLNNALR